MMLLLVAISPLVIRIGFEELEYFTDEVVGVEQVCVAVLSGQLQINQSITATIISINIDAQGR